MIILNVGTFDDPSFAKPRRTIFRDDALQWIEVHGEIPRFAKTARLKFMNDRLRWYSQTEIYSADEA